MRHCCDEASHHVADEQKTLCQCESSTTSSVCRLYAHETQYRSYGGRTMTMKIRNKNRAIVAAALLMAWVGVEADDKGDRIEAHLDARGDRIEDRLDARGDRIDRRAPGPAGRPHKCATRPASREGSGKRERAPRRKARCHRRSHRPASRQTGRPHRSSAEQAWSAYRPAPRCARRSHRPAFRPPQSGLRPSAVGWLVQPKASKVPGPADTKVSSGPGKLPGLKRIRWRPPDRPERRS